VSKIFIEFFIIFNHMSIPESHTKINIIISESLWNLFSYPSFFRENINSFLMLSPLAFQLFYLALEIDW